MFTFLNIHIYIGDTRFKLRFKSEKQIQMKRWLRLAEGEGCGVGENKGKGEVTAGLECIQLSNRR